MGRALLTDPVRLDAWRVMKILTRDCGGFLVRTVADLTSPPMRDPISRWVGWLTREDVAVATNEFGYAVVIAGDAPPLFRPAVGRFASSQRQLWRAMRSLRRFDLFELREAASTEEAPVSREAAQAYALALLGACYLAPAPKGWRLTPRADTGPRAPVIVEEGRAIFDLNLGRRVGGPVNVTVPGRAA